MCDHDKCISTINTALVLSTRDWGGASSKFKLTECPFVFMKIACGEFSQVSNLNDRCCITCRQGGEGISSTMSYDIIIHVNL